MRETLTILALSKRAGVSSKTLRYWESLGLLPRAARSHTGYRLFDPESLRYIGFIKKSKALGLTLAEMREILRLARTGRCPCPEVIEWADGKIKSLEEQIKSLSGLLDRLQQIRGRWPDERCPPDQCSQVCSLIEELPEAKIFERRRTDAKNLAGTVSRAGNACGNGAADSGCGRC